MPSKKLSSIIGGGVFRTETFVFNQTIASGQTGDLVTIGTAGKVTRLTLLLTDSATQQGGISIDTDGSVIVGPGSLGGTGAGLTLADFFIAPAVGFVSDARLTGGNILDVFGEFITIKKDGGNTGQAINYAYETGSIS